MLTAASPAERNFSLGMRFWFVVSMWHDYVGCMPLRGLRKHNSNSTLWLLRTCLLLYISQTVYLNRSVTVRTNGCVRFLFSSILRCCGNEMVKHNILTDNSRTLYTRHSVHSGCKATANNGRCVLLAFLPAHPYLV